MTSPTQRSLKLLKDQGAYAQVVERWNSFAKIRQDLFGVIDIVALPEIGPVTGVQVTSRANMSARIKKIKDSEHAARWANRASLEVHGWDKPKSRWRVKIVKLSYAAETGWINEAGQENEEEQ